MDRTLSNVYRGRSTPAAGTHRVPVLRVLVHAARPAQVTSRHRLDGVDEIELGRGEPGATRLVDGGLTRLRLRVADPMMSADHGRLRRDGERWLLDDPRSKNGAVVAGRPTRAAPVALHDVFELGLTLFLLDEEELDGDSPADLRSDELAAAEPELATFVPALRRDLATLTRVAPSDVPVLVLGESGTGKEICARALHRLSGRRGALVAVNCGGLSAQLVESELFGHRKGAFSGAVADRPGYLRAADGGTLFLDEIGDLPLTAQAALLRALQEREVVPVGDAHPVALDLRLCAATHRDLPTMIADGRFREDLYARLLGVTITLPPLRERRADLGLLIARLLARVPGGAEARLTPAAAYALAVHDWPLNVRELERTLAAAVARAGGAPIEVAHLPTTMLPEAPGATAGGPSAPALPLDSDEDPTTRAALIDGLTRHGGNVAALARELGKHREQLHRQIRRFGIDLAAFRR